MTEEEVLNMREVLKAVAYELKGTFYSHFSSLVDEGGYCQSMNFIAALLLTYMDKELAFYTQVCLNRNFFEGYFTDELVITLLRVLF